MHTHTTAFNPNYNWYNEIDFEQINHMSNLNTQQRQIYSCIETLNVLCNEKLLSLFIP